MPVSEYLIGGALKLIIAHALGDLALQHNWIGQNKKDKPMVMLGHCIIVAGVNYLLIPKIWLFFWILGTHLIIDNVTCAMVIGRGDNWQKANLIDQLLHGLTILIAWVVLYGSVLLD